MSAINTTAASPDVLTAALDDTAGLDPRRWRALPIILIGSFLSFLDFFIVNIALPSMRADLGATPAQLQFIVAAYGIGFGVFLITGGRLGDIFGRKRVFLLGIAGFTLASTLCGLAPTPATLIALRVVQAICAATITPQVLSIIRVEFTAAERPIAIGFYGASMGLASITAQLLGGLLVSLDLFGWSWRLVFLINIPIGLTAIALVSRMIRESRSSTGPTLDLPGVALASLGLFLLIYPIVEGREAGWPAWSFVMLAAMVPVLVGLVLYERHVSRRGRTPLIALHLLRVGALRLGLVLSVVFFSTAGVFFVVLTVFFQVGLGYSPIMAGLMFLPFAIGFSASSTISGPIANRIGPRIINLGSFLMALGLGGVIILAQLANRASETGAIDQRLLMVIFLVYGLGQGLAQPALINTVIGSSGVSEDDAGSAVGLFLTTAQSVIALGVAAIGDVFFSWLGKAPTTNSYVAALTAALSCNFVLMVATFALALLLPRRTRSNPHPEGPKTDVREIRQLADWYRAFADRAGNAAIWDLRLRTAEHLEAEASKIEARRHGCVPGR
jgi:MFS family permease